MASPSSSGLTVMRCGGSRYCSRAQPTLRGVVAKRLVNPAPNNYERLIASMRCRIASETFQMGPACPSLSISIALAIPVAASSFAN